MSSLWRFPASNFGQRKGISTGDTETFKKSPYKSFAREILQNSVDARKEDEQTVRVVFEEFQIETDKIPGIKEYKEQLIRCKKLWNHKPDYVSQYDKMISIVEQSTIKCLRISDYNTNGLVGIERNDIKGNSFLALTKGSGVSEKNSTYAGGSKGVGKNAAFLLSSINMVFYSTMTKDGYTGYLGVADLVSGYVNDDFNQEKLDYTQGPGYYGYDDYNSPIMEIFSLQKSYIRNESGTDIFVVGFKTSEDWDKEVINSLLDSFISAIYYGELEIEFNKLMITKENLENIVYSDIIEEKNRSNIISQYLLLKGDDNDVKIFDIETDYGNAELRILVFDDSKKYLSTHECAVIRYPYMKIKSFDQNKGYNVSAMCLIPKGKLGEQLRAIENPQHIDWETKRIEDIAFRKEMNAIIKSIKNQITDRIVECLRNGTDEPIDPFGASDFLSESESDDLNKDSNEKNTVEKTTITKKKDNVVFEKNPNKTDSEAVSLIPEEAVIEESPDGPAEYPGGSNITPGGGYRPGSEPGNIKPGTDIVFARKQLAGVRYKVICIDKKLGIQRIIFTPYVNKKECFLSLYLLDDANNRTNVRINSLICNGEKINNSEEFENEFGPFVIESGKKCILEIETNIKGYYGCEVKVLCK